MLNDLRYSNDKSAVLLLGNYRPAVIIARALAKRGFRIVLGSRGEEHGCRHSRFVHEVWDHPDLTQIHSFSISLQQFLGERRDIGFVLPVTEEFVNYFAAQRIPLAKNVTLASPPSHIVEIFADKKTALNLADKLGIATHPFELVADFASLMKNAGRIGYPLTIRPLGTTARLNDKKALILADPNELQAALPVWPDQHEVLLLQKFAPGNRHNVYFAARNGRIIAASESCIIRTNQPDGTGLAVDGRTVCISPNLFKDTQTLVAATGYTGIGLAQFIYEPQTGNSCFLELNPRVSGSHAVPEHAGIPLSVLAIELAAESVGGCVPGESMAMKVADTAPGACVFGRTGLRYAWTSGDLCAAKMALISGDISIPGLVAWLSKALRSLVRADVHMIWSLHDPMPGFIAIVSVLPRLKRLRNWRQRVFYRDHSQKHQN